MPKTLCSVPTAVIAGINQECGRPVRTKGMCHSHYNSHNRRKRPCEVEGCGRKAERNTTGKEARAVALCREHQRLEILYRFDKALDGGTYVRIDADQEAKLLAGFRGQIKPQGQCWVWHGTAAHNPAYGDYQGFLAHRWSYAYFIGGHGHGLVLDHACSNTLCVRPDHLTPITTTYNNRLRVHRGGLKGDQLLPCTDLIPLPANVLLWAMQNGLPCSKGQDYDQSTAERLAADKATPRGRAQMRASTQAWRDREQGRACHPVTK